jgi:hypothetical protein
MRGRQALILSTAICHTNAQLLDCFLRINFPDKAHKACGLRLGAQPEKDQGQKEKERNSEKRPPEKPGALGESGTLT